MQVKFVKLRRRALSGSCHREHPGGMLTWNDRCHHRSMSLTCPTGVLSDMCKFVSKGTVIELTGTGLGSCSVPKDPQFCTILCLESKFERGFAADLGTGFCGFRLALPLDTGNTKIDSGFWIWVSKSYLKPHGHCKTRLGFGWPRTACYVSADGALTWSEWALCVLIDLGMWTLFLWLIHSFVFCISYFVSCGRRGENSGFRSKYNHTFLTMT